MLSPRIAIVSAMMLSAIACGDSPPPAGPSPTPTPAPGGPSTAVTIPVGAAFLGDRAFVPGEVNVAPGTTVTWMNADAIPHTSTSDAAGWNSGIVGPAGQFSFTFETAGTFSYHCSLHPGMIGRVVVR